MMRKMAAAIVALYIFFGLDSEARAKEPTLGFPGWFSGSTSTLPSWLRETGIVNTGTGEQALQFNHLSFFNIKPALFIRVDHSRTFGGPSWYNRISPSAGLKFVYRMSHGVCQAGVRFSYDFRDSMPAAPSTVYFFEFYRGWDFAK